MTGGGREKDGTTPVNDGGFLVDMEKQGDAALATGVTYVADGSGFPVYSTAATNTTGPIVPFWVPRDYDEATDEIHIRFVAVMSAGNDTPTVTVTPKLRVVGSAAAAFSPASQTTAALSATQQYFDLVWRGQGLLRNTLVEFTFTSGAHATDALQISQLSVTYRSTLVSYHETDGSRDGKDGNLLR